MQRIIKFRGKRVDNGEWVYGYYTEDVQWDVDDNNRIEKHYIRQLSIDGEFYEDFEVDPATVGQFTGLTDKNGNEIYEGDVLSKEPFLKVTFENGGFCFSNDLLSGSDRLSQERVGRLSIISNIHENPELCKG